MRTLTAAPMRLLTATGLCLVVLLGLTSCGPFGSGTMTVHAELPNAAGVFVGNDVGVLGVNVGKITSIEPAGTHVVVTMEIDADQPIPADAGAVVVARSVATDRYIELTPVFHQGDTKMADGATIAQANTRTPVEFDEVLQSLSDFAVGIGGSEDSKEAIKRFINTGSDVLGGKGELLNNSIVSLSGAVNTVYGQRGDITSTLVSLEKLTRTLATNQATVREFINQVTAASEMLAAERTNFRDSLRAISKAVESMSEFVHTNKDQIVATLEETTGLMKSVLGRRIQLEEILRVMPLGLDNLRRAYTSGQMRVRVNPLMLAPLGSVLTEVCSALSDDLCNQLAGSNPAGIVTLLEDLIGGQQ